MKRLTGLVLGVAAAALIGCGDSSVECGEGTTENDEGFCVPTGGEQVTCTDGTMLDQATNTCVIDPASCQGGTVLIDNACQDPTAGLMVDVTEAAEPNALGVGGEDSEDPAGEFQLNAVGGAAIVLQGNLNPHPDADEDGSPESDFDTYLFQVEQPTLLEVSVDGVGGASGGFVTLSGDNLGLIDWIRFGTNLTGDTAKRQIFIPSAGIYLFTVADTRTLVNGEAAGDANNKYYASIKQIAIPTAENITITAGAGSVTGTVTNGEVKFYSAAMGAGFNNATLTTYNDNFRGSLLANTAAGAVKAVADENKSGLTNVSASVLIGGMMGATPTATLVVDHVLNTASTAVDFRLDVEQGNALAIPTTVGDVTTANPTDALPASFDDLILYYFDVNNPSDIIGLDLTFDALVDGMILDEHGNVVSEFSYFTAAAEFFGSFWEGFGWDAWQSYQGGFRVRNAGRYYLAVNSPVTTAGDNLTLHGAVGTIAVNTLTFGTPVTDVAPNAFNQNVYDYAAGGEQWQNISIAADDTSGGAYVYFYNKANSFGRLNDLGLDSGFVGGDPTPIIGAFADADDSATQGFITIGLPDAYYAAVSTIAFDGTFTLGTTARSYANEGTQAAGANVTHTGETLTDGTKRYLIKATAGSTVNVTVTPAVTLNLGANELDYDEFPLQEVDDEIIGVAEQIEITANDRGYVALEVLDTGLVAGTGAYTINYTVTAPTPPVLAYAVAAGTTAWANACNGGTDVTPSERDDGTTDEITIPTGFDFFAAAVTKVRINANGWLTFNTDAAIDPNDTYVPQSFPDDSTLPDGVIAPYWTDITNIRICTKTSGTKFIVQWRGNVRGTTTTVATQAILDSADDTIELVYAPYHEGDGTQASAGVESGTASQGVSLFFDEEDAVTPGTSKKLTPM